GIVYERSLSERGFQKTLLSFAMIRFLFPVFDEQFTYSEFAETTFGIAFLRLCWNHLSLRILQALFPTLFS
ncbi:MAG: hypothetical protein ACKVIB_12950, partial [Pseudomonadales bacterium]